MHELGGLNCKTGSLRNNRQIVQTLIKNIHRAESEEAQQRGREKRRGAGVGSPLGLARSEGEAGQLGWRGAEEVARLGLARRPTRLAKGAGEEAERGRRWR